MMNMKVSFHNVDHSLALEQFIALKSESLGRFLKNADHLRWVVSGSGKVFEPHLDIELKGESLLVKSQADDAFKAVVEVIDKAKRLLRDRHGRRSRLR
jgi:ribosome-associated translation inhibitor RaiA